MLSITLDRICHWIMPDTSTYCARTSVFTVMSRIPALALHLCLMLIVIASSRCVPFLAINVNNETNPCVLTGPGSGTSGSY
jgi:hypothetical protein